MDNATRDNAKNSNQAAASDADPGPHHTEHQRAVEPCVLYEGTIAGLTLHAFGAAIPVSDILSNGRANYLLFQKLVGLCAGLDSHSEGGDSDLSGSGAKYEVKAYPDHELYPGDKFDLFHTAASNTFSANNRGPTIKKLLAEKKYDDALAICSATGYEKNDFYVYTNTRNFDVTTPFRFLILPTSTVLSLLSKTDPRLISRSAILGTCARTEALTAAHLLN